MCVENIRSIQVDTRQPDYVLAVVNLTSPPGNAYGDIQLAATIYAQNP